MMFRRFVPLLSLVVAVAVMCACHSWALSDEAILVSPEQHDRLRLHLHDGRTVVVERPTFSGDSIHAKSRTVALSDVGEIEVRRFDWGQTMGLVFVTVVPTVFFTLLLANAEWWTP